MTISKCEPYKVETSGITEVVYARLFVKATEKNLLNRRLSFREASAIIGVYFRLPRKTHFKLFKLMAKRGLVKIYPYSHLELRREIENE